MFYSFVLKIKLTELGNGNNEICKYINKNFLNEILVQINGSTISNFFTKDKEFQKNKVYILRITSVDSEEIKKIMKYLYDKKIFNENVIFQNHYFKILEIIHNEKNSKFSKQMYLNDFLELKNLEKVKVKFLSPTVFKFGENYFLTPEPFIYFTALLKKFNQYFDDSEVENPLKKISSQLFKKLTIKENITREVSITLNTKKYKGFIGEAIYEIPENDLELGKIIDCLSKFSFFTGVGQFTEYGLGQVIIEE
ncbi:MAG: CRISPR system precrRNA processing endoribonuclease RAMP protein Cas6 [Fusobacteriaceae bacterium]